MKTLKKFAMLATLVVSAMTVSAQVFDFNMDPAKEIPDSSANGTQDTQILNGVGPFNTGFFLQVKLNIQGLADGFPANNGDYYATLTHTDPNNVSRLAVLLNRPGRAPGTSSGYGDNGMIITLQDFIAPLSTTAANDIHTYKTIAGFEGALSPLTGVWAPDGRFANPGFGNTDDSRGNLLSVFNGMDPNNEWTLFIQDASEGGLGKLVSWSLVFTAVPEPREYALIAGFALIGFALYRKYAVKMA